MKNIAAKIPGSLYTADDYELGDRQELQNTVTLSGQTLDSGDQQQLYRAIVNITQPIGTIIMTNGVAPASNGIAGIVWTEQTVAEGHIIMGHSAAGSWMVPPASTGGTKQTADDFTIEVANLPVDVIAIKTAPDQGVLAGGGNRGQEFGSGTAITVNLTELKRYGVVLHVRTA